MTSDANLLKSHKKYENYRYLQVGNPAYTERRPGFLICEYSFEPWNSQVSNNSLSSYLDIIAGMLYTILILKRKK